MGRRIEVDKARFDKIVRGKIRKDLKKYISQFDLFGRKGKKVVTIPIPQIVPPKFVFGPNSPGVGQAPADGDVEVGDVLGGDPDDGSGGAGNIPGEHPLEIDVPIPVLAGMLAEELELPALEPKGKKNLTTEHDRFFGARRVGPKNLRLTRRTLKEALKRSQLLRDADDDMPEFDPAEEGFSIIPQDERFRSWKTFLEKTSSGVVFYMMDVSGSMGDEQKEIVRMTNFWIDAWLQTAYPGLVSRYIIHDAVAREVDSETFYHTRESGGTTISSAYKLTNDLIDQFHPPADWNIYCFHFSDGDNWGEDNARCVEYIKNLLLPKVNLFCYGQVQSTYGSGEFIKVLRDQFPDLPLMPGSPVLRMAKIDTKDDIYLAIKKFLGKGK